VYQKDVLIGGGLGLDEIPRDGCSEFEQTVVNKPILLTWKDVMPHGEQISVAVDEPERQHNKRECPEPQNVYSPILRETSFETQLFASKMVNTSSGDYGNVVLQEFVE
jgi:hypothetical protein